MNFLKSTASQQKRPSMATGFSLIGIVLRTLFRLSGEVSALVGSSLCTQGLFIFHQQQTRLREAWPGWRPVENG